MKNKSAHDLYPFRTWCIFERGVYVRGAYIQGRRTPEELR
jgi:hypothetical protein